MAHVGIRSVLRPQRGNHIMTLWPMHVLQWPLGFCRAPSRPHGVSHIEQAAISPGARLGSPATPTSDQKPQHCSSRTQTMPGQEDFLSGVPDLEHVRFLYLGMYLSCLGATKNRRESYVEILIRGILLFWLRTRCLSLLETPT